MPGQKDPSEPMMIARKNLEFARCPSEDNTAGWPPLSLAAIQEDVPVDFNSREMMGEEWVNKPTQRPEFLRSDAGEKWIAQIVGRLVNSKSAGREELAYLLDFKGSSGGFGGAGIKASITDEDYNQLLEDLYFVPPGLRCVVEGSNSYAHLNGRSGPLVESVPDGVQHCLINLGQEEGEMRIHRKNLRLLNPSAPPPAAPVAAAPAAAAPAPTIQLPAGAVEGGAAPTVAAAQDDILLQVGAGEAVAPPTQAGAAVAGVEPQAVPATVAGQDSAAALPAPEALALAPVAGGAPPPPPGGLIGWLFGCGFCTKAPPQRIGPQETPIVTTGAAPGKFCPYCGKEILNDAKFCAYCGKERVI